MKEEFIKREDVISCGDCQCLVERDKAQEIDIRSEFGAKKYYCGDHRKKYHRIDTCGMSFQYYREMQVDKDGNPIGYGKIKK